MLRRAAARRGTRCEQLVRRPAQQSARERLERIAIGRGRLLREQAHDLVGDGDDGLAHVASTVVDARRAAELLARRRRRAPRRARRPARALRRTRARSRRVISRRSSGEVTNDGDSCSAQPRRPRVIRPSRRACASIRSGRRGSIASTAGGSSTAASRPTVRTSCASGESANDSRTAASSTGSCSTTRSSRRSRSMMSRFARPAAQAVGMPAVGVAVAERRGRRLVPERRLHALRRDHGAERHVARGQALRAGHEVGLDAVALAAEPGAEPAEAADDLVRDEQHVVRVAELADRGPVARRAAGSRRRRRSPARR